MSRRLTLTIIVNLLLCISGYILIILISRPKEQNDQTTRLRFTFLLGVHICVFIGAIILLKIQQLFHIVLLVFVCLAFTSLSLYICEIKVQVITLNRMYRYDHYANHLQKLELTYLNIYFLVYMYSLIGLVPSGLFLASTEGLMCWQEHIINKYKDKCLRKISYKQSLRNQVCSICLAEFNADSAEDFVEIKNCGHIFHEKCLYEWLRYQTKCPMDRGQIFVFHEDDDEQ